MRKYAILAALLALMGCDNDAQVASQNLSTAADNFQINRRIVFYNGISGEYILTIEGFCSLGSGSSVPKEITVTCKTGPNDFKKHFLGLSDNVTFFAEQMDSANVSVYHYKVIFKPAAIVPDIQLKN